MPARSFCLMQVKPVSSSVLIQRHPYFCILIASFHHLISSLYSLTCFLNYFLFPIIIPLFLHPLTMLFCSLLFCFLVPFSFHPFKLFPYFCIPAPGSFIFIPVLKAALFKCSFFLCARFLTLWVTPAEVL